MRQFFCMHVWRGCQQLRCQDAFMAGVRAMTLPVFYTCRTILQLPDACDMRTAAAVLPVREHAGRNRAAAVRAQRRGEGQPRAVREERAGAVCQDAGRAHRGPGTRPCILLIACNRDA